tara:strand:+ start:1065 stop:1328 length:264 start_codon:yes stop_codon:yes gene_type:complete
MNKYLYSIPVALVAFFVYTKYNNNLLSNEDKNLKLIKEYILNKEEHSILGKKINLLFGFMYHTKLTHVIGKVLVQEIIIILTHLIYI